MVAENPRCQLGYELVIKPSNNSHVCVTPDTAKKLVERGWTLAMTNKIENNATNQILVIGTDMYDVREIHQVQGNATYLDGIKFVYEGRSSLGNSCYPEITNQTQARDLEFVTNETDMHTHFCWPPTNYPQNMTKQNTSPIDIFSKYSIGFFDNQTMGIGWCHLDSCEFGKMIYLVKKGWNASIVFDSISNLEFHMTTNASTISSGHAMGIDLSTRNKSPLPVVVPNKYDFSFEGTGLGPCYYGPFELGIFKGYLDESNFAQGTELKLYQPGMYSCPASNSAKGYKFEPKSDSYMPICNPFGYCGGVEQMQDRRSYSGYWNDTSFRQFESGTYTIIAGDEWGNHAIKHFIVNSAGSHSINNQPTTVKTSDFHETIKDAMINTAFTELASSSTGVQLARGGGFDSYDNDSIRLELYHGKISDSHVIAATVKNTGKRTVHVYDINISGFIPIANNVIQNIIVIQDAPSIIPKEDSILEPGESQTKYIIGNWTVQGKPVNGFSAGTSYSYDDLQNYDGMTNGYTMSVPIQWIPQ
jgi:hypothetical protein